MASRTATSFEENKLVFQLNILLLNLSDRKLSRIHTETETTNIDAPCAYTTQFTIKHIVSTHLYRNGYCNHHEFPILKLKLRDETTL